MSTVTTRHDAPDVLEFWYLQALCQSKAFDAIARYIR